MSADIRRVAIIVPANNEEELLPACLAAIDKATRAIAVPATTIVALDSCTDTSAEICRRFGVETVSLRAGNVGRARAAGIRRALLDDSDPASVWLANTDADSQVPAGWLGEQLRLARAGADAVLGVVHLDAREPARLRHIHGIAYGKLLERDGSHHHVHGANLGVRASAYLRAGGFPPLANHEDRHLVAGLRATSGVHVVRSRSVGVQTSGRPVGRCDDGFAATLARLASPSPDEAMSA